MTTSRVRSAERVLDILTLVADAGRPVATTEIARELELPKSTAHHLVNVMEARGFLSYLSDRRAWTIGLSAYSVGSAYVRGGSLQHEVEPYLTRLTAELGMTSHLAVLQGTDVVYLAKHEPRSPGVRLVTEAGTRLPAHLTAVGRALLAQLEPDQLEAMYTRYHWPERTGGGPSSLSELRAVLDQVRQERHAVERGSTTEGIACVAAPLTVTGRTVAAIGVAFVEGARTAVDLQDIATSVRATSTAFAEQLAARNGSET